jgi:hypothetical protein
MGYLGFRLTVFGERLSAVSSKMSAISSKRTEFDAQNPENSYLIDALGLPKPQFQ